MVRCRATACWVRHLRYSELSLVFSWSSPSYGGESGTGRSQGCRVPGPCRSPRPLPPPLSPLSPPAGPCCGPPGSCRWCSHLSRAAGLTGTRLCSHRPVRQDGGYRKHGVGGTGRTGVGRGSGSLTRGVQTNPGPALESAWGEQSSPGLGGE